MKIKSKIQLFSTVWLLCMILLINSFIYFMFYKISTNTEMKRLERQTEVIAQAVKPHTASQATSIDLLRAYIPTNGMIRIINDKPKAILVIQKKNTDLSETQYHYTTKQSSSFMNLDGERFIRTTIPLLWKNGEVVTLEVTEGLIMIERNLYVLQGVLIVASLAILIPSFISGRVLSKLILKPIETMTSTMKAAQKEGTYKKIPLSDRSKDELQTMAVTYNGMMDLLEKNYEKQQQFVSDASHELKTPLTIIQSYAQLLKRRGLERPEIFNEAVDAIDSEATHMKEMTQQLLKLANSDSRFKMELEKIDINSFCNSAIKLFSKIDNRDVFLRSTKDGLAGWANQDGLKQVLFILLDNAIKYSSENIEMAISEEQQNVLITVKDYGIGIPAKDIKHVLDRFYRVDKARNRDTGGSGLGLSIAHQIMLNMNGNIKIKSHEGIGTEMTLVLKRA